MNRSVLRPAVLALALLGLAGVGPASAQYFGRNKVQYRTFDFRILRTPHFDIYFYPAESLAAFDGARMAERWYTRHSATFSHQLSERKMIVFYADHADFEQTNVVPGTPEQGEGGVTEGVRARVVIPFTGSYFDNNHVIGHELVHVFQYDIAESGDVNGLARVSNLPLWMIEGMAEYLSLGRNSPLTAMWMRDAVERDSFPTLEQLTNDPRFFPYRYGQAFWAYVAGRWGEHSIADLYRTALKVGLGDAITRVLGETPDSLSKDWAAANKALYTSQLVGRTKPQDAGQPVIRANTVVSSMNVSPVISPDGKELAFFSSRSLFTIDLYLADAKTGKIIRKLASPSSDPHFDALNFVQSSGAWSPDGKQFAFMVDENGIDNVAIVDVGSGKIVRKLSVPGVGAVTGISWSPNGKLMALSGMAGGISDIYVLDLQTDKVRQLTHDRYADEMPAFSPDGQTIAFCSDRGPSTSFQTLQFSQLQLATISVNGGPVTIYSPFPNAKEINPQYTPDGKNMLFVSDQDGFSDIYRLNLATGEVRRVTKVATGVSGITETSPAITVSQATGRLLFTVFQGQNYAIYGLDAPATEGVPAVPTAAQNVASILPPGDLPGTNTVTAYLNDPLTGLVSGSSFTVHPYHSSFALDAISQPTVGVQFGGYFGTGLAGGIAALWGDQLGDRQLYTVLQANGTLKDIGGAVQYLNLRHRWNWSLGIEHVPYLTGFTGIADTTYAGYPATNYYQILQRIYIDQVAFSAQYPFSTTRRFEVGLSGTRLGYDEQVQEFTLVGGQLANYSLTSAPTLPSTYYTQANFALVSDNSNFGYTSPVSGGRWRVEVDPTFGQLNFQGVLADYRRYFFLNPFTIAIRGLHYGRYGRDAEAYGSGELYPIYLGDETLIRGYGYGSFSVNECAATGNSQACPVFDRLLGSRIDVFNLEFRIPLLGSPAFGLFPTSIVPVEIAPFFDAGIAYSSTQPPDWRLAASANSIPASCSSAKNVAQSQFVNCVDHIPVFSAGITSRVNLLGYLILEVYLAHPFERPLKPWVVGVQLAPGW